MKLKSILIFISILFTSFSCLADDITTIINLMQSIQGYQNQISNYQLDIDGLTKQIQNSLSGSSQWGDWGYTDYQSWGDDANKWQTVLNTAKNGGSSSSLGQELQQLASQFPINTKLVNSVNPNATDQQYYALQAQTALAARSASQLGYDKVQDQINYQNQLRKQIGAAASVKQAVDLQNRIVLENNLIQLEMLRQLALLNQQQSVATQANVNDTVQDANFLKLTP